MSLITSVAFLEESKLDNIQAQNRKLSYDDLLALDFRYLETADSTTETLFEDQTADYFSSISVSATRTLVTYQTSGTVYRFNLINSETGAIIHSVDRTSAFDSNQKLAMALVQNNRVLLCYGTGGIYGRAVIISTDSDLIAFGTSIIFNSYQTSNISVAVMDSETAIVAYKNHNTTKGCAQILNISSALYLTDNEASAFNFCDYNLSQVNIVDLTSTTALVAYLDSNDSYLKMEQLTRTSNSLATAGAAYNLLINATESTMLKVNATTIIAAYKDSTNSYVRVVKKTETGLIPYNTNNFSSTVSGSMAITKVTDSIFTLAYSDYDGVSVYSGKLAIFSILSINTCQSENTLDFSAARVAYISSSGYDNQAILVYQKYSDTKPYFVYLDNFVTSATERVDLESTWNGDYTSFLANFEDTLSAGNVTGSVTGWRLRRKAADSDLFETLGDFALADRYFVDCTPRNLIEYIYSIFSLSSAGESLGIETTATASFYGWVLTDNTTTYLFDMGWDSVATDSIKSNKNSFTYENYTEFPVVSFGIQDYRSGNLNTIPFRFGDNDLCREVATIEVLNELKTFINDGGEKWLKNSAGEIFKIVTLNFNYKYSDKLPTQPYEISFDWIQVGQGEVIA